MSSNDSDEARSKPSASSRPRPNKPLSTAQRVRDFPESGADPREDVLSKRPTSATRPVNARRSPASDELPRATPAAPGATNGHTNGATNGTSGGGSTNGSATNGSANGHSNNGSRNGSSKRSRVAPAEDLAPVVDPAVERPVDVAVEQSPAAPTLSLATALAPAAPPAPPAVAPQRIDPGMMPAPAPVALAPAAPRRTKAAPLPALFDDEANPTGPIAFDRLFDTGPDPTGPLGFAPSATRQRTMQFTRTGRRSRPRIRRVTRVVRHVDPWSVFKVALCFSLVLYGVCLTAGVLLWNVAYTTGTIDNVQRFFESFGWDTFRFKGGELFHNAWIAGLFASLGLTGLIVLAATLFNLITDLVGGIRVTVLEEEVVERNPVVRGPLLRRRTRAVTGIMGRAGHDEGYPDDGDSLDSPQHFG